MTGIPTKGKEEEAGDEMDIEKTSFDKLEKRIIIDYSIETLSDLRIGGHESTAPGEADQMVIRDGEGYPIIPGSSIKGILRSEMEKLLRSLGLEVCDAQKTHGGCGKCTVCFLFGGGRYAGSIRIRDARADTKRSTIRDGVGIDRKTRKAATGVKYNIEVIPRGIRFSGTTMIENPRLANLTYVKLDAFLTTVRFFNETLGAMGGATSRGFGQVQINIDKVREVTAHDYLEGNFKGNEIPEDIARGHWKTYLQSMTTGGN